MSPSFFLYFPLFCDWKWISSIFGDSNTLFVKSSFFERWKKIKIVGSILLFSLVISLQKAQIFNHFDRLFNIYLFFSLNVYFLFSNIPLFWQKLNSSIFFEAPHDSCLSCLKHSSRHPGQPRQEKVSTFTVLRQEVISGECRVTNYICTFVKSLFAWGFCWLPSLQNHFDITWIWLVGSNQSESSLACCSCDPAVLSIILIIDYKIDEWPVLSVRRESLERRQNANYKICKRERYIVSNVHQACPSKGTFFCRRMM